MSMRRRETVLNDFENWRFLTGVCKQYKTSIHRPGPSERTAV